MARAKKVSLEELVAERVRAGDPVAVETVDFSDPNRPKTCLEVDFPILPVNQVAVIEGNAGKPIYQMSKWWARRRSSVFRTLLLSAAMKAPEDPGEAAKAVWDVYYRNHQALGSLAHLKVADIFSGGGTTLVEGSRLGMQMIGSELNPVAWFVIRNEFAQVSPEEVQALLEEVEAEVKPALMPYYACDCPRGHRGQWTDRRTGAVQPAPFEPWTIPVDERKHYDYAGPEMVYVFWSKHGPCPASGCGHRTPLMSSPVMAVKNLSVKAWKVNCGTCGERYDLEQGDARMAPAAPFVVAGSEAPFAVLERSGQAKCPHCGETGLPQSLGTSRNKKIELTLLLGPEWLRGCPARDAEGQHHGGSATDDADATRRWLYARAATLRLIEVRGTLPSEVRDPETGELINTARGTIPKNSVFECGGCGARSSVLGAVKATATTGPIAPYAIQGYCSTCDQAKAPYGGRFFATPGEPARFASAEHEWSERRGSDLAGWWPTTTLPFGHLTHQRNPVDAHGFTDWSMMFNARQLLVHAQLLRSIIRSYPRATWACREFILGAFQQYLRNQNLFCFWDISRDCLAPHMSNNNYHPKTKSVENSVFAELGRGNWQSSTAGILEGLAWSREPWEVAWGRSVDSDAAGKSLRLATKDPVLAYRELFCCSATELKQLNEQSLDMIITDPPFEGLLHYSELADFFYVWLQLVLKSHYPDSYKGDYSPKQLEAVANRARHGDQGGAFYKRILTECWREAYRTLKSGGLLAFTFHHSQDEPWINVLESLFEAGFYLEAIYPIRSDETKGEGEFGSKTVEYDMIHVCRKRIQTPTPISWARLRRAILEDVQQLRDLLESHAQEGLPAADLQVIRRGKALEHFSRHYGQVFVDADTPVDVRRAILGVNQLLDETVAPLQDPPPASADPLTRQFLRIFAGADRVPRADMIKSMQGTGIAPSEFEQRGWCKEANKVFELARPLEVARIWHGQRKRNLTHDLDQCFVLVGACWPDSGIRAEDTLNSPEFKKHPALRSLLEWMTRRGAWSGVASAAKTALQLLRSHEARQPAYEEQGLFS